jgi:hypothetical protein
VLTLNFFKILKIYIQTIIVSAADRLPKSFSTPTFIRQQKFSIYLEHLALFEIYRHLAQAMQIFKRCDLSLDAETDLFFPRGL